MAWSMTDPTPPWTLGDGWFGDTIALESDVIVLLSVGVLLGCRWEWANQIFGTMPTKFPDLIV